MFPNVLQQEIVNFLNICEDDKILKIYFFTKAIKKLWLKNSIRDQENGKIQKYLNGITYKSWVINGKNHREDGPAIEYSDGYQEWFINGKRHCLDGPAFIDQTGGNKEYYINGKELSKSQFKKLVKHLKISNRK